ncbi:MAG: hypothetical protein ACTHPD_07525, partial [Rhizomicrobium sp.]
KTPSAARIHERKAFGHPLTGNGDRFGHCSLMKGLARRHGSQAPSWQSEGYWGKALDNPLFRKAQSAMTAPGPRLFKPGPAMQ